METALTVLVWIVTGVVGVVALIFVAAMVLCISAVVYWLYHQ